MVIQRGSTGIQVERVQLRLRELGLYKGPLDGSFGGGTEAAVKSFQIAQGLFPLGSVDARVWAVLFPDINPPAAPPILSADLTTRCLALTASFETSVFPPECFCGVAGDFDGQGLSFGALQWNIGQGTLQPLFHQMINAHPDICQSIFHEHLKTIQNVLRRSVPEQIDFVRTLQDRRSQLIEPWRGMLKTLGATSEFQAFQTRAAHSLYLKAVQEAARLGLTSQRGIALLFDIMVQNGSLGNAVRSRVLADFTSLPSGAATEVRRMVIISERRSAVVRPRFRNDVLTRKLTIANGEGTVHGLRYDLASQFGLTLDPPQLIN